MYKGCATFLRVTEGDTRVIRCRVKNLELTIKNCCLRRVRIEKYSRWFTPTVSQLMYRWKDGRGLKCLLNSRENLRVCRRVSKGLGRVNP